MKSYPLKLLLISLLPAFLFSGCGDSQVVIAQQEQTEITLSWWGNDDRNEYTIQAVQEFEELYPEIKVKCSYSEWSGYESRSHVQMISATEADVMQVNFNWLSEYSADGHGYYDIESLSDYIDLSNFSENALEHGRMNGILNALPIAMNTETVYINKTLYQKYGLDVPQTWDDFFHAAEVMRDDGIYPLATVSKSMWLYSISYAEQISGKTFLKEDGALNFTADEFQIMLELYARLTSEKVMPQVEYFERIHLDNGLYAGALAWVSDAVNYMGKTIENGDEVVAADYTSQKAGDSGAGWYAKPATLYAISVNTEHPKESALLLDFLLNSQEMAVLQGIEKGIPLSASARNYLEEENMLTGIQYEASLKMEETENLEKMQPFLENANIIDDFIECCNAVLYEKQTAEEAAKDLYQRALMRIQE